MGTAHRVSFVGAQNVHIFNATRTKKPLAKIDTHRTTVAGPVYAQGKLFVFAEGWLYAIGSEPKKVGSEPKKERP